MIFLAVVGFLALFVSAKAQLCPNETLIEPCLCSSGNNGLSLKCENDNLELGQLYKIFDDILKNETALNTVQVQTVKAIYMRKQFFGHLTVKKAAFNFPSLKTVHHDAFKGQETSGLESIIWMRSSMSNIPIRTLNKIEGLKEWQFKGSNAVVIAEEAFKYFASAQSLEILSFRENKLEAIMENAMDNLANLKVLDLSKNMLLRANGLPKMFNYKVAIDFSYNKLITIPSDLLDKLPAHSTVKIQYNAIRSSNLQTETLRTVVRRHLILDIEGNELDCSCPLKIVALANNEGLKSIFSGSCKPMNGEDVIAFQNLDFDDLKECYVVSDDAMAFVNRDLFYSFH